MKTVTTGLMAAREVIDDIRKAARCPVNEDIIAWVNRLQQAIRRLNLEAIGAVIYHTEDCALATSDNNTLRTIVDPCDCNRDELQALVDALRGD